MAYYKRDPWGEERADLRAALNTAALSNTVQMLAGGEYREINLMPYAAPKVERELTAAEEFAAVDKLIR